MKLSKYNYKLPAELIPLFPEEDKDEARLLVVHRNTGKLEHKKMKEVIDYFDKDDVFVFNNTKVFPAKLKGIKEKNNADIEVLLLRELDKESHLWDVLVSPARKIRIGNKLFFGNEEDGIVTAEVIDNTTSRGRTLRFITNKSYDEFKEILRKIGTTPLPVFVKRESEKQDRERYQTVIAKEEGGIAAPTAGLHFSKFLLKRMEIKDIKIAEITLHTGMGTFRQIEVEDLSKYKIDSEEIIIPKKTAEIVNKAKLNKKRVCSVGTTVLRTLESSISTNNLLNPFDGWTNKFLFYPYQTVIPNAMITNLHMPYTTMMINVSAFIDIDLLKKVYKIAVKKGYKFGTFGDSMLIL